MPNGGGKRWLLLLPLSRWVLLLGSLQLPAVGGSGHVVTRMRGFDGPLPFYLETGYVEVDEQQGVQLFYYFVRSERDPYEDPLLLWLSGGPGCSGISGLAYEIGPLKFDARGQGEFPTLLYRPETWTKVSNIIFVDSPVGTGFSYAKSEEGLETGDTKQVKQLVIFLRKWLQDHPRFVMNPLYIAGDSYSGLIIPTLALEIDRSIELGEKIFSGLKGYIAGNPLTGGQFDTDSQIPYFHAMGLVSDELYKNARENCGGKYSAPLNAVCAEAVQAINNSLTAYLTYTFLWPQEALYILSYAWGNDDTVQESLGIRKGTIGAWKRYSHALPYNYDIQSVVDYHSRLATKGYRALIYRAATTMLLYPMLAHKHGLDTST
ncbi:serine carboxypeptidase1 [Zea mays]|uniref:Serine carboxypeptidase1 n=1 Tax=Zea mays TaxID=4577 RepID=A0A1D6J7K4_MAIZE|nr:serine carboxypeptidase1 [Zea mays]